MTSDSGFIQPEQFSENWQNISVLQTRRDNIIYTGERYGRRFLLKALQPQCALLTEYRLQQEKEFRLGIAFSHPNIAATYSLENVPEVGRCIVQEWIDGQTLNGWLQTHPSLYERKRVWEQLMNVLAYVHSYQRVHHDLKPSNILITRNGQNVKLIDFGLADSDDGAYSEKQSVREDIQSLAPIIRAIFPHRYRFMACRCERGGYPHIEALQKVWQLCKRTQRLIPLILSVALLIIASILFWMAYQERHAEQRKQQEMMAQLDKAYAVHAARLHEAIGNASTYIEAINMLSQISQEGWAVRDSLMALYPSEDPIRVIVFDLWTQRDAVLQNELIQASQNKPMH